MHEVTPFTRKRRKIESKSSGVEKKGGGTRDTVYPGPGPAAFDIPPPLCGRLLQGGSKKGSCCTEIDISKIRQ